MAQMVKSLDLKA